MKMRSLLIASLLLPFSLVSQTWPAGKEVAISLSFDDARESQVLKGTALLDSFGVKATFYVVPSGVRKQISGWTKAVASGHEIGNHSLTHPCSGNFTWSRKNALEEYSMKDMKRELQDCNKLIRDLLGVEAVSFAYPCGQTYVGQGKGTKSYVPLVAKMFRSGRDWLGEASNDPAYPNWYQLSTIAIDEKSFEEILPIIEVARKTGAWIIFGGHEMDEGGYQTTKLETLRKLLNYANDPANKVWIQPVSTVEKHLKEARPVSGR
jgi:peptidoglycan/xylan/chitin deacetylase (PgdA/CDA1 family)